MLKKKRPLKGGHRAVTFQVAAPDAESVHLVGNFNDWAERVPMTREQGGRWTTSLDLETSRAYEYRYLVDEREWVNDPEADAYVPNPYGTDNSVVRT